MAGETMSHELGRCARCGSRKYEALLKYDRELKDFVCRDETNCKNDNRYKTYNRKQRKK